MTTTTAKRAAFRSLHESGCFVIPNPWDVGSGRLFQHLGFKALASSSAGLAWSLGRADNTLTRDDVLAHLPALCAAVDLPVNADFESGFAKEPAGVAERVRLAFAVERIRAAMAAIASTGQDVLLVARTEGLLRDATAVKPAIDKLVAAAPAGADVLFAPGVREKTDIAAMVRAVAPKPLNVVISWPGMTVAELADLGVRRISVGGALARVAWNAVIGAAEQLAAGSFDGLAAGPSKKLNEIFARP